MPNSGPIMIVEDDVDDQEILADLLKKIDVHNEIRFFNNGQEALDYLKTTSDNPFIILSDVNMPVMNGLEFRQSIIHNDYLKQKSIPFVFLTTTGNPISIEQAFYYNVQGFFQKANSFSEMQDMLKLIIDYWRVCKHPNFEK